MYHDLHKYASPNTLRVPMLRVLGIPQKIEIERISAALALAIDKFTIGS